MNLPVNPPVLPMLATRVSELPAGDDWMFEPKWDGFRTLVFRDREEATLADLVLRTGIVLATGGGVVIRARNRLRLRENGTVLYLHADPSTLRERTRRSRHRPLLVAADSSHTFNYTVTFTQLCLYSCASRACRLI